jgi:hypothetical protein
MSFAADVANMDAMIFTDTGQGSAATYTPLSGSPSSIYVIVQLETEQRPDSSNYRIMDKNPLIWIQVSDIAQPAKGDRIAITGGATYQVASVDQQDEFLTKVRAGVVR